MTSSDYSIRSTSHLITIPHPPSPHFLVQILHLKDSLSINVFQSPNPNSLPPGLLRSDQTSAKSSRDQTSSTENGASGQNRTKDEELDEELAKALAESGRIENQRRQSHGHGSLNEIQNSLPLAKISKEWSVAMNPQVRNPKVSLNSFLLTSPPCDLLLPLFSHECRLRRFQGSILVYLSLLYGKKVDERGRSCCVLFSSLRDSSSIDSDSSLLSFALFSFYSFYYFYPLFS